jgi:hypothetical protein
MLGTWIDYSGGPVSGAAMSAAGITGAIRYVGIGGAGKRLTHAEYADHVAHGRQTIAVVEKTTTDADGGAAAGTTNARAALADLATITAGLAPIRYVFMANDQNRSTTTEVAYVRAASAVLTPAGYVVGPYGFGTFLAACAAVGLCPIGWQAGPAPSRTGTAALATFWQRQGGPVQPADGPTTPVTRVISGVTCDLSNQLKGLPDMTSALTDQQASQLLGLFEAMFTGSHDGVGNYPPIVHTLQTFGVQLAAIQGALSKEEADLLAAVAGVDADTKAAVAQIAAAIQTVQAGGDITVLAAAIAAAMPPQATPEDFVAALRGQLDKP